MYGCRSIDHGSSGSGDLRHEGFPFTSLAKSDHVTKSGTFGGDGLHGDDAAADQAVDVDRVTTANDLIGIAIYMAVAATVLSVT